MSDAKTTALTALRLAFRPIARIMLRAGVNWRELTDVLKATYVEVATEDYGIRGRPTNISRVAILTGLSRKEVKRLRDLLETATPEAFSRINSATRVLSGWHQDEQFLDASGKPIPLAIHGDVASFDALCKRYGGGIAASTMLKELKHVGALAEQEDGRLAVIMRTYMPTTMDPEHMLRSGSVLEDMGYTVAYNLDRSDTDPGRFEGRAANTRIPAREREAFRDFVEIEAQEFLEKIDAWLSEHELEDGDDGPSMRLGLGVYWIEGRKPED